MTDEQVKQWHISNVKQDLEKCELYMSKCYNMLDNGKCNQARDELIAIYRHLMKMIDELNYTI